MSYVRPVIDPRDQPLDAPFKTRIIGQKITATNDYTGTFPDAAQSGTVTTGGIWLFSENVNIRQIEFRSIGTEASGRDTSISASGTWYHQLTSGIYVQRQSGGAYYLIQDLSGTDVHVTYNNSFSLLQGESLLCVTGSATKEMHVAVTARMQHPYLSMT